MCVENIMFSLIRSEVCGCSVGEDIQNELTGEKHKELFVLSKKHDLSHIVASALSRIGMLKNDEISNYFNKQLMMALFRDGQKEYALNQIGEIFEGAKIPHIMLKGAVIRQFYPEAWMRTSCDIDILIQKKDAELAIETLCNAGYVRLEDCSTHDYNFMSPNKIHIELHYTLTQDGQINSSDKILESVWEFYTTLADGYYYRYNLKPEVFLLYHLAHMGRHFLHGGCGIRPFIDLWLIKKHMTYDNEKLYSLLNQAELLKFYEATMELSEVWLDNRRHNESTKRLEDFILNGGVYGTTSNAAKVKAASGVSKMRSFISIMFLKKKNLQVLYPILVKYPILIPIYQVKRWFKVFNKNKQQKVKHLIDVRNSVLQGEEDSTIVLLQSLGLY